MNIATNNTEYPELLEATTFEDANHETMISVNHVSMEFNMASEKMSNLKEYAIALAKGKLFFESFKALDDVSFEVKKGDVFGILGTNGSGKSTLLKIIAGVLSPTSGTCEVRGNIAPLIELGAGFDMELSARENIYLNGALLGYSKTFIAQHFDEIVEFAEIEKFLDMPMKNYSSGMIARIAFAIATVIVPEILIVDEVLSVGDFMFQQKCEDRINDLINNHGVTVLLVSHSNDQIERLCNKAIWIEKGRPMYIGNASNVAAAYQVLAYESGSEQSRKSILDMLKHNSVTALHTQVKCETLIGDTPKATGAALIESAWAQGYRIAFICDASKELFSIANALAGTYDAPIFSLYSGELDMASMNSLKTHQPNQVFIISNESARKKVIQNLLMPDWVPTIIEFDSTDLQKLSREIFTHGRKQDSWHAGAVFVNPNSPEDMLLSAPLSFKLHMPVFAIRNTEEFLQVQAFLKDKLHPLQGAIAIGFSDEEDFLQNQHDITFQTYCLSRKSDDFNDAFAPIMSQNTEPPLKEKPIYIAPASTVQWNELLSCGCCAGHQNTALIIVDYTNLDAVNEALVFVEKNKHVLEKLIFTSSSNELNKAYKKMFKLKLAS